ncbi:histidinol dehydrogenase [Rapidithrix thailandica]|uniref:Histidinol dehydrogenase n=1 Tax=Rapidithrix thailandica TaxID=413964 RepID=A0AAW9SDH0_9BACT
MQVINYPTPEQYATIIQRPVMDFEEIEQRVRPIMEAVKTRGDEALREYSLQFDKVAIRDIRVTPEELEQAESQLTPELKEAIQVAYQNIETFHRVQKEAVQKVETMEGVTCWRKSVAIQKVGLYIPGGTAPLFSTVLMLGIPAKLAGCEELVLCTPPNAQGQIHPAILFTANLIGIQKVYKVGGAQAIAAMTFGTESISKVYKIFGPGNQYVTAAKQLATKEGVAIDMPAGPSEVAVLADRSARPAFIAADLLSQAEHGVDSQVLLITDHPPLVEDVQKEVESQLAQLPRKEIAVKALENSRMVLTKTMDKALELVNEYAAEHLIIATDNADELADSIYNAGSVFLGHYTPESAGDYASGTNHTLPTYGFARNYSGVSLDSFIKKVTFQKITKAGIEKLGPYVEEMAAAEQLDAHKNAVTVRIKE